MALDLNPTAPRPEDGDQAAWSTGADQPDVQRPEDEARPVRHQLLLRADHVARPHHLRGHVGAHEGDRAAGRCARLRGARAHRPLAGLRRQHELQRQLLRDLHLGGGAGRGDGEHRASSPPPTCRPCTRSSRRRPPSPSTTSPAGGSGSTSSWVGSAPRWTCSTVSNASTTSATRSARSGSTWSRSCGARRGRSARTARSSRGRTWSPTRSRTRRPTPCSSTRATRRRASRSPRATSTSTSPRWTRWRTWPITRRP